MKLSRKIFKIVGISLIISILLIYIFSKNYLLKSFSAIEEKTAEDNTKRILKIIEKDIANLSSLSLDYSIWNETYDFMENHNENYIKSNFTDLSPFKELRISFFMFVDNSGKIVYSKTIDTRTTNETILNEFDVEYIKTSISSIYKNTNNGIKGILQLHNMPVLITGQPIVKDDGSGISRGFLIMIKPFDDNEINYISKDLNFNIGISNFQESEEELGSFHSNGIYTKIQDNNFIFGHGLIKDIFGDPALVVNLKMDRVTYKQAQTSINYFILILILIAVLFNIFVLTLLDSLVIRRISKIMTTIDRISETEDLTQKLDIEGKDELTKLGAHFNKMFEKLNKSRHAALKLAYYDPLTGLPNRKKLLESLELNIKEDKSSFAIFYIDLDNFKSINDTLGHNIGDIILEKVANRFKSLEKENNLIARIGGDEFVVVQYNIEDSSEAEKLAIDISKVLKPIISLNNSEHYIAASIGISIYPYDGKDVLTLMKNADVAMYAAKKKREHGYEFYSKNMNRSTLNKLILENALRQALNKNQFVIYYQPIQSTKENSILGSEALIRWILNDKLVPPDEFIPIAKHIGEIVNIDNWVLHNACIECKKWNNQTMEDIYISINISFKQLKQQNFIYEVKTALENAKLEPRFLNLEITEDEAMEDVELTINILQQLKDMGVNIALDDFGTGYSSLSYVNRLPIDTLKIDRSLINHIHTNNKNYEIVKSTIAMAHSLDIKVIAEGIENLEQLKILTELNCDAIQGFYLGKPMESREFQEKFLI